MTMVFTKLKNYAYLVRLNKPIGIYLLLWPTLWALWIASSGFPNLWLLFVFVLGTVLMRSAGCAINDYADRKVDGNVKRTQQRMIPAGLVSPKEAKLVFLVLSFIAFLLVLTLNVYTIVLSFVALAMAFIYPFCKRYTHWPQLILGLAFSFGIPMAFAAVSNHVPWLAWYLYLTTMLWTIAYDSMYAMVDRDDDLQIGVKSTAILFGRFDVAIIAVLQMAVLVLLLLLGLHLHLNLVYYLGWLAAVGFVSYQIYLIKDRDRDACFRAFLNNHWLGLSIFLGLVLAYL